MYLLTYDTLPQYILNVKNCRYDIKSVKLIYSSTYFSIILYKNKEYEVNNKYISEDYNILLYNQYKRFNFYDLYSEKDAYWLYTEIYLNNIDTEYILNYNFNRNDIFTKRINQLLHPELLI